MSGQTRIILSIQAHPDDTDFFAGGTVAKFTKEGDKVTYVTVTDGCMGTLDPDLKPEKLRKIREEEQRRAAKILRVEKTIFLGYRDSELYPSLELRSQLIKIIREIKPNIVMTHDPWKPYQAHPDHRNTGTMAIEAAAFAILPQINHDHIKEGLETHYVEEIYLFDTHNPNTWIDTTDTIEAKIKALTKHESQAVALMGEIVKELDSKVGEKIGKPYAEAFKVLKRGPVDFFVDNSY